MAQYKMTLQGLETLAEHEGFSIFEDVTLPEEGIDRDLLIATIFQRSNEFEVLYADPFYMRGAAAHWFEIYSDTIQRWIEASQAEYNPIENYDRQETYTGSDSGSGSGSSSNTDTEKRAAFNSSSFENYAQNSGSGSSSNQYSNTDSHTSRIHGNIGVTTSVAMLKEHVDFWGSFNLYMAIADIFIKEFCLMVY